jgi:hypothetical protein
MAASTLGDLSRSFTRASQHLLPFDGMLQCAEIILGIKLVPVNE